MIIREKFDDGWLKAIGLTRLTGLFQDVNDKVEVSRKKNNVLPEKFSPLLMNAFERVPFNQVKVVILGMDPYHTPGVFNGLAFGNGTPQTPPKSIQPSLRNIEKEVKATYPTVNREFDYSLERWAQQGVLLLNVAHTVIEKEPGSHLDIWEQFTKEILLSLSLKDNVIWMLWGRPAAGYEKFVINKTHRVIKKGHPSPLNTAHPFVGSGCFVECDTIAKELNITPIQWI